MLGNFGCSWEGSIGTDEPESSVATGPTTGNTSSETIPTSVTDSTTTESLGGESTTFTDCPTEAWGQFSVQDHFDADTASDPGCSTEPAGDGAALRIYAVNEDVTKIKFHLVRADGGQFEFGCDACLALYVGQGPKCQGIPNVIKGTKPVVGHPEQTILLDTDIEYEECWKWNLGETKQFWASYQTDTGFSSSGVVHIERRCQPPSCK